MSEQIDPIKAAQATLGELIKVAGDHPNAKSAAANAGQALVTLTEFMNVLLMPVAGFNYIGRKAQAYFKDRFPDDLAQATADLKDPVEPRPSIAGPALQGLAYSHDDPDLKALYLKLLASAMERQQAPHVHPSFVSIVGQMTGEEAALLKTITNEPIVNIQMRELHTVPPSGWVTIYPHVLDQEGTAWIEPGINRTVSLQNLSRLGLLEMRYDLSIPFPGVYEWADRRPERAETANAYPAPRHDVRSMPGVVRRTDFGKRFCMAAGLPPNTKYFTFGG